MKAFNQKSTPAYGQTVLAFNAPQDRSKHAWHVATYFKNDDYDPSDYHPDQPQTIGYFFTMDADGQYLIQLNDVTHFTKLPAPPKG